MSRHSKESPQEAPNQELDPKYDHYEFPTIAPGNQPGHPGHTTKEQDAQVFQLRAMLEQAGCTSGLDTLTLLRFLRARKFNVELSKQMCIFLSPSLRFALSNFPPRFLNNEKWRKEFGVEDLVRNFEYTEKPQVFQYYPQYYHKTDKVRTFFWPRDVFEKYLSPSL